MYHFPTQTNFYSGKVRNVHYLADNKLVMVATNRISAFDVILPQPIPYKGQVLNQIAAYMLQNTTDICKNWLISTPAPTAAYGYACTPYKIEMVVRGNLTGHAWRTYQTGARTLCGATMPNNMAENDFFSTPIITPTTKASHGHDEDITPDQIIATGLCTAAEWEQLAATALALFARGKALAAKQNLILVDTKYEFGLHNNQLTLMDEIHTPDSSRYFYAEGFEERQATGQRQKQLSKEFVREWLIQNNFMGKPGQQIPQMSPEWIQTISQRYIELYEKVIGQKFVPATLTDEETYRQIIENLNL
jgi:phosphoribosylaminoimidazole-succinocarboxamide synthase